MRSSPKPEQRLVEVDLLNEGEVAVVTLNRPGNANAVNIGLAVSLLEAMKELAESETVKAVVLTGSGDHFCAGADRKDLKRVEAESRDWPTALERLISEQVAPLQEATRMILSFDRPVIAAVNGAAVGGGLDLALACHYRVAAHGARLSSQYAVLGLPPMNGGAWLLPRLLSKSRAMWLLVSGEQFSAEDGAYWGIVDEVVPHEEVLPRALAMCQVIRQRSPELTRWLLAQFKSDDEARALAEMHRVVRGLAPALANAPNHRMAMRSFGVNTDPRH